VPAVPFGIEHIGRQRSLLLCLPVLWRRLIGRPPRNGPSTAPALAVIEAIAVDVDRPLWSVFRFDPLSQDVLNAFVHLHETLQARDVEPGHWPHFGDALVLAHGLAHGFPVASNGVA